MSIQYDENKKTYFVKTSYVDNFGTRRQSTKRGFKTKREAKQYESEFLKRINGNNDMTFESLINIYLEDSRYRLKRTTLYGKTKIINTKILPFFKQIKITDIDTKLIRQWQNYILSHEHYSQTYIKTINNQLAAILNFAVKFYNLPSNPMRVTGSIGKKKTNNIQFWTLEEFNTFMQYATDKPQNDICFHLLFYSGMRIGELLALTLSDFNYENETVTINKSFSRLNKEDIISEPKTEKSNRIIKLPSVIFQKLDHYISKLYNYVPDDRLFKYTKHYFRHEIKRICKLSGVKIIRVHDLRHSHASLLINLGVMPKVIQERLGHEDIETTLNTYSHLYPNQELNMIEKLKEVIERSE